MSGWFSMFTGRKNVKEGARDSIINLRQSLLTLEKKEEYLNKQIEDDLKKARANAATNKQGESGLNGQGTAACRAGSSYRSSNRVAGGLQQHFCIVPLRVIRWTADFQLPRMPCGRRSCTRTNSTSWQECDSLSRPRYVSSVGTLKAVEDVV